MQARVLYRVNRRGKCFKLEKIAELERVLCLAKIEIVPILETGSVQLSASSIVSRQVREQHSHSRMRFSVLLRNQTESSSENWDRRQALKYETTQPNRNDGASHQDEEATEAAS